MTMYPGPQLPVFITHEKKTSGYAVAAFIFSLFSLIPILAAVSWALARRARRQILFENMKGSGLVTASVLISNVLGVIGLAFVILALVFHGTPFTPAGGYVKQTFSDVQAAAIKIQTTIRANPSVDARKVAINVPKGEVITVTYIDGYTWTVRGYHRGYGNPSRDYIEFLSWGHGYDYHGSYQPDGDTAGEVTVQKYALSVDLDVVNTTQEIQSALAHNPQYDPTRAPLIKHGDNQLQVTRNADGWQVTGSSGEIGSPNLNYVRYSSKTNTYRLYGTIAAQQRYIQGYAPSGIFQIFDAPGAST